MRTQHKPKRKYKVLTYLDNMEYLAIKTLADYGGRTPAQQIRYMIKQFAMKNLKMQEEDPELYKMLINDYLKRKYF